MADFSEIKDEGARRRIRTYVAAVRKWSVSINLTGASTEDDIFTTLVMPVLGSEDLLAGPVIDVGSGNGSPALVLAALRPEIAFTLLEPRAKRWAFLRQTARDMGLDKVSVERQRSDEYRGATAQTVTMRAVGLAPESLRGLLVPGGCVLVFGGPPLAGCEPLRLPGGGLQRRCFT